MIITVLIFVMVIFITIISTFFVGFSGIYIKRSVINIPFYLIEKTIKKVDVNDNNLLVFDYENLEQSIDKYLSRILKDRCYEYKFKIWPYKYNENNEIVFNDDFSKIEHFQFHFKGFYFKNNYIETYATYSIKEKSIIDE